MIPYPELDTPAVIVDLAAMESNLVRMADRAKTAGVRIRPHAKTHKSTWIANRQLALGAAGLTVAKLGEAEVFADAGCTNILVAYPIVGGAKLARLHSLAARVRIVVALDDLAVARGIGAVGRQLGRPIEVMVEVDSGLHRCGRTPGKSAADVAAEVAAEPGLRLLGLLTHAGHVYRAGSPAERDEIALEEGRALVTTNEELARRGIEVTELSIGSTPTAAAIGAVARAFPQITEIRPGTYVFNDVNQMLLGVANEPDCALRVLVTVVARPSPDRMVVDAGSKTLAADHGLDGGFGRVAGHPEIIVTALSEEHGVLQIPTASTWGIGDRLEIIPNHACPVSNLADELVGVGGGAVIRVLPVDARGRNR